MPEAGPGKSDDDLALAVAMDPVVVVSRATEQGESGEPRRGEKTYHIRSPCKLGQAQVNLNRRPTRARRGKVRWRRPNLKNSVQVLAVSLNP